MTSPTPTPGSPLPEQSPAEPSSAGPYPGEVSSPGYGPLRSPEAHSGVVPAVALPLRAMAPYEVESMGAEATFPGAVYVPQGQGEPAGVWRCWAWVPRPCRYGEHRPDDDPDPGDQCCLRCGWTLTWRGPSPHDWAATEPPEDLDPLRRVAAGWELAAIDYRGRRINAAEPLFTSRQRRVIAQLVSSGYSDDPAPPEVTSLDVTPGYLLVRVQNDHACQRHSEAVAHIPAPDHAQAHDLDAWARDDVPHGDGHPCGAREYAIHELTIIAAPDHPDLLGARVEWDA